MSTTDAEHLEWLLSRCVEVYGENPNVDFLHRLRKIIKNCTATSPATTSAEVREARDRLALYRGYKGTIHMSGWPLSVLDADIDALLSCIAQLEAKPAPLAPGYMAFLDMAGRGCISGQVCEWPQLVPACRAAHDALRAKPAPSLPQQIDMLVGRILNTPRIPCDPPVPQWYISLHNDATDLAEEVMRGLTKPAPELDRCPTDCQHLLDNGHQCVCTGEIHELELEYEDAINHPVRGFPCRYEKPAPLPGEVEEALEVLRDLRYQNNAESDCARRKAEGVLAAAVRALAEKNAELAAENERLTREYQYAEPSDSPLSKAISVLCHKITNCSYVYETKQEMLRNLDVLVAEYELAVGRRRAAQSLTEHLRKQKIELRAEVERLKADSSAKRKLLDEFREGESARVEYTNSLRTANAALAEKYRRLMDDYTDSQVKVGQLLAEVERLAQGWADEEEERKAATARALDLTVSESNLRSANAALEGLRQMQQRALDSYEQKQKELLRENAALTEERDKWQTAYNALEDRARDEKVALAEELARRGGLANDL